MTTHASPARRRALIAAVAAPAALAALPAVLGAAPVIATDAVCLRPVQQPSGQGVSPPLNVTGTGFTPNSSITITRGARTFFATSDAAGNLATQLSVLDRLTLRPPASSPLDIVAADPVQGPSNSLRVRTAPLEFDASPRRARPSQQVRFRFSGFEPDRIIYAHYRFAGRVRANVPMGRASNPCGLLTARRPQIPVRDAQVGLWRVQFDHSKAFSPRSAPRISATVTVFRTVS